MSAGLGIAIAGSWLPLVAALVAPGVRSIGVWLTIGIGAITTGILLHVAT